MNANTLSELLLYRYRYVFGYLLLAILTVGLLGLNITVLPPGLSQAEEASALASNRLTLDSHFLQTVQAIDLPYHLLQKTSLHYFGLGTLGVRLPSLILAALTIWLIYLTLRRWFQANVAIVMGTLTATSSWFHSFGRIGTPDIMIVFWTALILFLATLISQEAKQYLAWKVLIVACIGLSFYTPLMIYVFVAAAIASISQPHLRYLVRYDEKISFFLGLILLGGVLVPLGWQVWREPGVIQAIIGLPAVIPDPITFAGNLLKAADNTFNPFHYSIGLLLTPLITIPVTILAGLGLARILRQYHAVRSHVLLIWLAVLIPIIGLGASVNLIILFIPITLCTAIGLQTLFEYWYGLFPYNPYARIFGLIPIGLLLVAVLQFGYQRYFIALPYAASTTQLYDLDLLLAHGALTNPQLANQPVTLVVPPEKIALYNLNHDQFNQLSVLAPQQLVPSMTSTAIVAESVMPTLTDAQRDQLAQAKLRLIVDDHKDDALRFRVFSRL